MKRSVPAFMLVIMFAAAAAAQSAAFPGITPAAKRQLAAAKRTTHFPLPTWVPAGFAITDVRAKLGARVPIEDRHLVIVYERRLASGRLQRFSIEAGFDGLGDLMYDGAKRLRTPVGDVWLLYQPIDQDGKKMADFSMTEWFEVGRVAYHYDGMFGSDEERKTLAMISLSDTQKILHSLRRY